MKSGCAAVVACLSLLGYSSAAAQQRDRSVVLRGKGAPPVKERAAGAPAPAAEKRYWADPETNTIRRSNVDGTRVEIVVSGLDGPYGLSYDQSTQQLIWTSSGDETVQAVRVGESAPTALTSSFEANFAIEAQGKDKAARQLVAYAVVDGAVTKLMVDETGAETRQVLLRLEDPRRVRGLALSDDGRALYIGDAVGRMSQKLRLTDGHVQPLTFVDDVPAPDPDALDEEVTE